MAETLTSQWSEEYYLNKMFKTYSDLVSYWTDRRPIMKSERLDQSAEFIAEQAAECAKMTAHFANLLDKHNKSKIQKGV